MADSSPARSRRRGRRWLVRLVVTGLLLVLATWFAPIIVAKSELRQVVLDRVFSDLDAKVSAGSASLGWLSTIELRDITITDPAGKTVLVAERLTSSRNLLALALDRSDVGTFTIERPVLEVVCEPGDTNVERAIARYLIDDGSPPDPERMGLAVTATQGRVVLKEAGKDGEQVLEPFELTVTVPRPRSEPITLSAAGTATGPLATEWVFADEMTLTITADRFTAETLGPFLRRFIPGTELAGQTSGKAVLRWVDDLSGQTRLVVDGRAEVDGLDLVGPWLGADRIRLARVELPCKLEYVAGELRVEDADLTCDVGTLSVAGVFNPEEPIANVVTRPGLNIAADLDLARLATLMPRLLRLREGTALRDGRVVLRLASKTGTDGTTWDAELRTTSLKGTRNGQTIDWESPLELGVVGRVRDDGLPVFDKFVGKSDFAAVNARGSLEQFVAAANVDLDRLAKRLSEFVDLGGTKLEGQASLTLRSTRQTDGSFAADGTARLTRFIVVGAAGHGMSEPELLAEVRVGGKWDRGGSVRLDRGEASLSSGADQLNFRLVEPVADVKTARTGKVITRVAGAVGRWRNRVGWLGIPADWQLGGDGTVDGVVSFTTDGVTVEKVSTRLANAHFKGEGIDLNEPTLTAECGVRWDRKANSVALTSVRVSSETLGLSAQQLDLKPTPDGSYGLVGKAAVTANVNRVQRAVGLQSDPAGADALGGLARGSVRIDMTAAPMAFDADLNVEKFSLGAPAKPVWAEPQLKLVAVGDYDSKQDSLHFRQVKLARDGLAVDARGGLSRMATTPQIVLDGTIAYDLAKLEPKLKAYLGKDARAVGQDSRPFKLAGRLDDGENSLTAKVGQPVPHQTIAGLNGSAAVAWRSLQAYGFDVGPGELRAALDGGVLKASPVEATFGGGTVRLEPTLNLLSRNYDLSLANGRVVERARLTPESCADAIGFALPAIANAAQADGLVSFDLENNLIPLADPDQATFRGKLTVHEATVSAGPMITELATLFGANQTSLTLAKEQVVPVRMEKGRVHHENFTMRIGQSDVRTSGSVGVDGSLSLVLDLPVPQRLLDRALGNNPIIRESLAKQRIRVPVGGTLKQPRLDRKSLDDGIAGVLRGASKSATEDLIEKGAERLLDELMKRRKQPRK